MAFVPVVISMSPLKKAGKQDFGIPRSFAMGVRGTEIAVKKPALSRARLNMPVTIIMPSIIPWDFKPSIIAVVMRLPRGLSDKDGGAGLRAFEDFDMDFVIMYDVARERYVATRIYTARRVFCKKTVATVPIMKTGLAQVDRAYMGTGFSMSL